MSVHLVECAAELELPSALKLALLCFADSGSNESHIALPGIDGVMKWCCVSRSQAFKLIARLRELDLLEVKAHGYRGRRSEYVVFPNGCCDRHGKVSSGLRAVGDDLPDAPVVDIGKGSPIRDSSVCPQGPDSRDPLPAEGSHRDTGKGLVSPPERVSGPRSVRDTSQSITPKATTPDGYETGPVTSRATDDTPNLDFTVVDMVQPDRLIAGPCGDCEAGWIVGSDGIPIAKCPQCHPGYRRRPGETA